MRIEFRNNSDKWEILLNGQEVLTTETPVGCTDSFEMINEQAFYWHRKTDTPVTVMKMTIKANFIPRYFLVPGVNYNGNGWGSGAQYYGYGDKEQPWCYAWHRVSIPACTYTESDRYAVALFGEETDTMSCSVYPEGDRIVQELIWPEVEAPKVLYKRCWAESYQGQMQPRDHFTAIVMLTNAGRPREKVHDLLDLAWRLNYREVTMRYTPERIRQLDLLFMRSMWWKKYNGLVGIRTGINWNEEQCIYKPMTEKFESGWTGQNIAVACALLDEYLENGDEDARDKAIAVLDSWDQNAFVENGLMLTYLEAKKDNLDSILNGDIRMVFDSCQMGTAATYFFEAARLCAKAGIQRPSYRKRAYGLCDFFIRAQQDSGEFAKSYFMDGSIEAPHGSVGAFILPALFAAYDASGKSKYLTSALKGLDFYLAEFNKCGCTTAGALDSNCIDKESGAPILRSAILAYENTADKKYLDAAVEIGYYLATWQWHYSTQFPDDSLLKKLNVDTYGSTAVSAAHNALDHYGAYWVPEYLKLAELTGDEIWKQRARALWYNCQQLLSDGTLVIRGRVRPAGSQDESFRHTRWGRIDRRIFIPSEWCTVWQGSYRHQTLNMLQNWDILR